MHKMPLGAAAIKSNKINGKNGRSDRIRTYGLLLPKVNRSVKMAENRLFFCSFVGTDREHFKNLTVLFVQMGKEPLGKWLTEV